MGATKSTAKKAAARPRKAAAKTLGTETAAGADSGSPTASAPAVEIRTEVVNIQILGDDGLHRIVGTVQEVK